MGDSGRVTNCLARSADRRRKKIYWPQWTMFSQSIKKSSKCLQTSPTDIAGTVGNVHTCHIAHIFNIASTLWIPNVRKSQLCFGLLIAIRRQAFLQLLSETRSISTSFLFIMFMRNLLWGYQIHPEQQISTEFCPCSHQTFAHRHGAQQAHFAQAITLLCKWTGFWKVCAATSLEGVPLRSMQFKVYRAHLWRKYSPLTLTKRIVLGKPRTNCIVPFASIWAPPVYADTKVLFSTDIAGTVGNVHKCHVAHIANIASTLWIPNVRKSQLCFGLLIAIRRQAFCNCYLNKINLQFFFIHNVHEEFIVGLPNSPRTKRINWILPMLTPWLNLCS